MRESVLTVSSGLQSHEKPLFKILCVWSLFFPFLLKPNQYFRIYTSYEVFNRSFGLLQKACPYLVDTPNPSLGLVAQICTKGGQARIIDIF